MHVGVEVGALDERGQLQRSVGDDRVALLGPVEGDPRNPVGDLVGHRLQVVEVDRPDRVSHGADAHALDQAHARGSARDPAGRHGAERAAPLAVEPGGQERLGDRGMAVAHQQRALQRQADVLGDLAGAVLDGLQVAQLRAAARRRGASRRGSWPAVSGQFVEQHLDAFGPGCHGAQRVQRADVAGALPDAHQRGLAVEPRHTGFLDVAVAAQAFHRLGGVRGGALAHPVLAGGQPDAAQQRLAFVAAHRAVGGAGHPHRDDGGRLGLDREVGQHVAHQRLVDQVLAERLSMLCVVDGAGQSAAHAGGAAQRAVQPGEVDHLDDGRARRGPPRRPATRWRRRTRPRWRRWRGCRACP